MADNVVVHGVSTTLTAVDDSGKALSEPVKSTNGTLHVTNASYEEGQAAGHDFDRLAVASIMDHYLVTATGTAINGPALVGGIICLAGTSPTLTLYDAASATGDPVFPAVTLTVGEPVMFTHPIRFLTAVHAVVGGTATPKFRLLALAAAAAE